MIVEHVLPFRSKGEFSGGKAVVARFERLEKKRRGLPFQGPMARVCEDLAKVLWHNLKGGPTMSCMRMPSSQSSRAGTMHGDVADPLRNSPQGEGKAPCEKLNRGTMSPERAGRASRQCRNSS